jgi:hypothetical protein
MQNNITTKHLRPMDERDYIAMNNKLKRNKMNQKNDLFWLVIIVGLTISFIAILITLTLIINK